MVVGGRVLGRPLRSARRARGAVVRAGERAGDRRRARGWPLPIEIVVRTVSICLRWRVTGLAAEAGFFALLSLPPLVLGLAAAAAAVGRAGGVSATEDVTAGISQAVSAFLTPEVVDEVVVPTLQDAFAGTRIDLISVGFLFAIWSGSRAINVFVDTISIMYGLGGIRGIVRARLKSLGLHLVTLVLGVISLPLLVLGPDLARRALPDVLDWLADLTWPVALLAGMLLLATLYHTATPVRSRWARDLPGAALALLIWLGASVGLRVVVSYSVSEGVSIYGPLTAVIVLLIWLYALALAVLIGAGLNAAVDQLWPVPARVAAREARDGTAHPRPAQP